MSACPAPERPLAIVTGGAGFLGAHLLRRLTASGKWRVAVVDLRAPTPAAAGDGNHPSGSALPPGVEVIVADLRDAAAVVAALAGAAQTGVVFHAATAAPTGANAGKEKLMYDVNVTGTRNVIAACVEHRIPRLVYTSTASVVFAGRDLNGVDETAPVPPAGAFLDFYTSTKAEAEAAVRAANGVGGVSTVCLRPSGIFGEHDRYFFPSIVDKAASGKLKYIIGSGTNRFDWTYAGNVAQAHEMAALALTPTSPLAGSVYFITNDDPRSFWGFLGDLVAPLGYPRPRIHLPLWLVWCLATLVEAVAAMLAPLGVKWETDFTRARMVLAACERRVSCDAARRDFGYVPEVGVDEAVRRTVAHFEPLRAQ
ncbi:hypothetical protein MMPV_000454 [Pyropia vietnamensis]